MLIFVSVHLLLFSFFVYHLHDLTQMSFKSQINLQQRNQQASIAEQALNYAQSSVLNQQMTNCVFQQQSIDYFVNKSSEWWYSGQVCNITHSQYSIGFVTELIMTDPCASLQSTSQLTIGVRIFRIHHLYFYKAT